MNLGFLSGIADLLSKVTGSIPGLQNYSKMISIVVVAMMFLAGSYAVVAYSDKLPDGSKCYFNAICFVPTTTINAIKTIPTATP